MDNEKLFYTFPEIETKHLYLREISHHDAAEMYKIWSDRDVMKYFGMAPLTSLEQMLNIIDNMQKSFDDEKTIRWAITKKYDNRIIGSCGFHSWAKPFSRIQIGYELSKDCWRQGIMSEAVSTIIDFGFDVLKLNRIEALVEPPNKASSGLLLKLGFKYEGTMEEYQFGSGRFMDLSMYALLRKYWNVYR
jgi:ribosomal-protein-alanine N-acetyltransferase